MTDNPYLNYPVKNKVRRANSERIVNSANECNRLLERITKLEARIAFALRVNQAGFVGFVPDALKGRDFSHIMIGKESIVDVITAIIKEDGFDAALGEQE
jgi:hypothetical protein